MRMKDLVTRYSDGGIAVLTDDRVADILYGGAEGGVATQVKAGVTLNRITRVFKTGVKPVMRLVTVSGFELTATCEHKVMTEEGWIMMQDLRPGQHRVLIQPAAGQFNDDPKLPVEVKKEYTGENGKTTKLNLPSQWTKELGQVLGWLVGDGWLIEGDNCRVGFTFSRDDEQILDLLKPVINGYYGSDIGEILRENGVHHLSYHSKYFVQFFRDLGVRLSSEHNKEVPPALFTATEEAVIGFLQGLFTADGTVGYTEDKNAYIRLTARSVDLLKGVQQLLLNLGIKSKIYDRSRGAREGFEYIAKSGEKRVYTLDGVCFELAVSRNAVPLFLEKIGFLGGKHASKIERL
jgi:ribonucleoside-diphosphate reductase alpha chain